MARRLLTIALLFVSFAAWSADAEAQQRGRSAQGGMKIRRWNKTRDGDLTHNSLAKVMRGEGYDIGSPYVFHVGGGIGMHSNGVDMLEAVMTGRLRFDQFGESKVLEPGDMVWVPAGVPHGAQNVGNTSVTLMLGGLLR